MIRQKLFLVRTPDPETTKRREAEMYFQRRDRMNFKEGFLYGILAATFVLLAMAAIVSLIMWMF
jgi:hypothetical protein